MPTCQKAAKYSAARFWHSSDSRSSLFFYLSTDVWVASIGRTVAAVATGLPYVLLTDRCRILQLGDEFVAPHRTLNGTRTMATDSTAISFEVEARTVPREF
jgi:hypothetical protein